MQACKGSGHNFKSEYLDIIILGRHCFSVTTSITASFETWTKPSERYMERDFSLVLHKHATICMSCVTSERTYRVYVLLHHTEISHHAVQRIFCFVLNTEGFSHISNHTALIADKHRRECHHIKPVCFWTLTILHCNKLDTGVHNRLSGFCALQICIETTQPLWAYKTHSALIYAKLQEPCGC